MNAIERPARRGETLRCGFNQGIHLGSIKSRMSSIHFKIGFHYMPLTLGLSIVIASLPYSSLERDFCRRRQAPQKGPEVDVSVQRPEIGDYHVQISAAKAGFLLASYQLRVSEDWVVGAPGLEPGTR